MSSSPNSSSNSEPRGNVDAAQWLMDVPCPVDFVLGTTTVKVRECAAFAIDSVIRLKQTAGADLEVRVSGIPMFSGEVVIVDDSVALRVGRVLAPTGLESV
jgi:flagellar motor switch/type III secretory pathway protein FliN